jgi:hypothetical protein
MDVHSINNHLGEDTATYSLFKDIELKDKQLAEQCFGVIEPMLVERGEYNLCLGYMGDPQGVFDRLRASREQSQKWEADQAVRRADEKKRFEEMGQTNPAFARLASTWSDPPKFADNNFVGQIRQLIEILVGAGRKPEADKIRDEALMVLNDDRIKSAVTDAEQKIKKQTQAEIQTN